ncbi:SCO2322 family protein [Streptomyces sp. NPDC005955]|uniref:SCO2322 family protein n=1 Tax=Streptomyces sp. NPDC005955 TaxID=3364738 RepID=UPI0036CBAABF
MTPAPPAPAPGAPARAPGRVVAVLTALLTTLAVALLTAAPAQAAGYRYWSFWDLTDGSWTYATQGPALARPADGDVQGFRFSVSEDSGDAAKPRGPRDFAGICGATAPRDGTKRVALVIDPGTPADAPGGETPPATRTACARVGTDATSAEALAAVAKPLRYDSNALLCAIDGYPRTGCGEQVSADRATTPERPAADGAGEDGEGDAGGGPSAGIYVGAAAVAALGVAAVWRSRRRG